MIRGNTENGSQWVGFVRGALFDRLTRGETVTLDGHTLGNGQRLHAIALAMPASCIARLERGERVCLQGTRERPHFCFFLRDTNAELIAASHEFFPGGLLPNAPVEHVSPVEPS